MADKGSPLSAECSVISQSVNWPGPNGKNQLTHMDVNSLLVVVGLLQFMALIHLARPPDM